MTKQAVNPRDVTLGNLVVDIRKNRDTRDHRFTVNQLKSLVAEAQRDGWLSEIDRSVTKLVAVPCVAEQKLTQDKEQFKWKVAIFLHLEIIIIAVVTALEFDALSWFK